MKISHGKTARFAALFSGGLLWCFAGAAVKDLPNFLIINADDLGYGDLGSFGSVIKTPRIDAIGAQGVKFTNFYVTDNICSPSRASLMTGDYFQRLGVPDNVYYPDDNTGMNVNEVTIADLLKRKNYATALFGKWHIGHRNGMLPTYQGFDYFYGTPVPNDHWIDPYEPLSPDIVWREGWTEAQVLAMRSLTTRTQLQNASAHKVPLMRDTLVIEFPADQPTLTQRYANEAIKFIAQSHARHQPFFVYFTPNNPHQPLSATSDFLGKSAGHIYGDAVEELDFNIGRILDTLKTLGLDSTTLVVFTSDNGPDDVPVDKDSVGNAGPLRGLKHSNWEGGHREPTVMMWPGKIPAGFVQDSLAANLDLYPTIAALAGIPLPTNETVEGKPIVIDGVNIWPLMTGQSGAGRGVPFYYDLGAIRSGPWKYFKSGNATNALYNLVTDIHEDSNVRVANATLATNLSTQLNNFTTSLNAQKHAQGGASTPKPIDGCTNPAASNYNATAGRDDGSCVLPMGCMDPSSPFYDSTAWVHVQAACSVTSVATRESALKNVTITNAMVYIGIMGKHTLTIQDLSGKVLYYRTATGITRYSIGEVLKPGTNIVRITVNGESVVQKINRY